MNFLKALNNIHWFKKPAVKQTEHIHSWELQYRTGTAIEGKTEVLKCDCGNVVSLESFQMAIKIAINVFTQHVRSGKH